MIGNKAIKSSLFYRVTGIATQIMYLTWLKLQKRHKMGWYFANMLFDFIKILAEMFLITLAGTKRKVGRPSVIEAQPEIVEIVRDFITQHSSSAHDWGCDDLQHSHGVTLSAIHSHILREIPALKKISVHTIHCLLLPPNKNPQHV